MIKPIKWNGKPITRPGIYTGIPLERYHSAGMCDGPSVSSTDTRTCWVKRSPAHMFVHWAENPNRVARKVTREMVLGSAAHHLILGEDDFKLHYVSQPLTYRDKKTAKEKPWHNGADDCAAWNEKQKKAGKTWVTEHELAIIVEMSKSLALEPLIKDGLLAGLVECSGFAKDEETGLWLKIRPDVVPTTTGEYIDLKTASEIIDIAIQYTIRSRGYHMQGALIWEVVEKLGLPFEAFILVFAETAPPHCSRMVPVDDEDLSLGRLQNRAMLRWIARCIDKGHWPGPGEGDLRPLPLSSDERERIVERLKFEGMI